jgi:ribosomal peptide maturation radical SAM protein 1
MAFRSKSPQRVLEGIEELARRYNLYLFEAVDNILDHRYIQEVFAPLTAQRNDYNFFYEVKANLTHDQLRALVRAGVRRLQPGIESLDTHILQLMQKGTTGIQNVRLLKWADYYGITVAWNVLVGFPGERPEDYERQLAVMRLIPHLQPPDSFGRIWLERFSPYFSTAETSGILNVRPDPGYALVYPEPIDLDRIAYFFEYDAPDTLPRETHEPLLEYVRAWQAARKSGHRPYLGYLRGAGRMTIVDGRQSAPPQAHVFEEPAALAYEVCSPTYHSAAQVYTHLRERGIDADLASVQRDLDGFTSLGVMLEENGVYLSLAQPSNGNW